MVEVRVEDFAPLPQEKEDRIKGNFGKKGFSALLGLVMEEVRQDYSRMRLPYRPQLEQPMGILHGGALAALVDTVVVGAILSGLDTFPKFLATIDLHVHYLGTVVQQDVLAEAWIRRRGRSVLYCAVDARTEDGAQVAHGELAYRIVV
jgi:uncharacterized protein (TIGR00369 family)